MLSSLDSKPISGNTSASRRRSLKASGALASLLVLACAGTAAAAQPPVGLGTNGASGVLGGQSVTNTGPSIITGDLGVSPGTAITGFPPGLVLGVQHSADAVAGQAQSDLTTAYDDAAGRNPDASVATELGGQTLTPGAYNSPTLGLTGDLTLNAQGNPNAVFIFQAASTLITASNSSVTLINGAQACNVYWQVGSSATLGTGTRFVGNVLALTSISAQTGATVQGRLLARNGSVTLDTNTVTRSQCAAGSPGTPGTPGTGTVAAPDTGGSSSTPTSGGTATDKSGPKLRILGVPRITSRGFTAGIRVSDRSGIKSVRVYLNGKRVKRTSRTRFSVRVSRRGRHLGRNRITVSARDRAGNVSTLTRRWSVRRAQRAPAPRFTG